MQPDFPRGGAFELVVGERVGFPEEIGATAALLSSRRAGFITGQNLTVDGGESL